jgi:hypothetical protein
MEGVLGFEDRPGGRRREGHEKEKGKDGLSILTPEVRTLERRKETTGKEG